MDFEKSISALTGIPCSYIQIIVDATRNYMCDKINSSVHSNNSGEVQIDIGIGNLVVMYNKEDNIVRYRFEPNTKTNDDVCDTIQEKYNPLVLECTQSLINRLIRSYKELI